MAVQPGKPHLFLHAHKYPEGFPIVTPTTRYEGRFVLSNGKQFPVANTCWWHVAEHDKVYGENYLRPLDNPGDDEVDIHSLRKDKEHHE